MPNPPSVPPPPPPPSSAPPPQPGTPRATTDAAKAVRPWYQKKRIMVPLGIVVLAAIGSGLEQPSDTNDVDTASAAATPSDEPTTQERPSPDRTTGDPTTPEPTTQEPESEDAVPARDDAEPVSSSPTAEATPQPTTEAPEPEPTSEPPAMTRAQENALRQGGNYLDFAAFSRSGLIEQLEFEGYSTEDATLAVDALNVDWNEQAALKAEDYLSFSAFSRSGLIEQLEFEGFTREQAEYGVTQAGL